MNVNDQPAEVQEKKDLNINGDYGLHTACRWAEMGDTLELGF